MFTVKEFLNLLSGFLTPLIAGLALMIAYRQYKVQEYRVRFDLYEPRMKIYESIMGFLSSISQTGNATNDELVVFLRGTSQSKFLFKGEMEEHIDAIYKRAVELQYFQTMLNSDDLPVGPERTTFAQQKLEHSRWLGQQYAKTNEMFIKYVKLDK